MKSRCRCCQEPARDSDKRFCPVLGFICEECHDFMQSADKRLRRVGIEGVTVSPVRFKPEVEKP